MQSSTATSIDYGLDAPGVCRTMWAIGSLGLALAIAAPFFVQAGVILLAFSGLGLLAAAYGFFMGGHMLWSSRIGKRKTRERLLDLAQSLRHWTGSETVLDVGCGRGLMLIGAAKRLVNGKAIGIDIWNPSDQTGNSPAAVIGNSKLEGVHDKVCVETADARALPFADDSIDVILSHWVIHNLPSAADRRTALDEMWRVLKRGGIIVLADIAFVQTYAEYFRSKGASRIVFENGGWRSAVFKALSGGSFSPQAVLVARD